MIGQILRILFIFKEYLTLIRNISFKISFIINFSFMGENLACRIFVYNLH